MSDDGPRKLRLDELSATQIKALIFDEMEKIRVAEGNIGVLRRELTRRERSMDAS